MKISGAMPDHEVDSAGLNEDAVQPLDVAPVRAVEIIFVMEPDHRRRLTKRFGAHVGGKKVVRLNIPDRYEFMDAALVALLEVRVTPHLRKTNSSRARVSFE